MNKKIYIASPMGFSESGRFFLYRKIVPVFTRNGLDIIDPWNLTPAGLIADVKLITDYNKRLKAWADLNNLIAENNMKGIMDSDGVFAVLDGTDVDSGTASEIGFASAIGKPVTAYRGDFRLAGDNEGSVVNLQVAWFIYRTGGKITTSLEEAEDEIVRMFISSSP